MKAPCRQLLLQQSFSILGLQQDSVWGAAVYSQASGNIDATFYEISSSLLWFTLCKCKKGLLGAAAEHAAPSSSSDRLLKVSSDGSCLDYF